MVSGTRGSAPVMVVDDDPTGSQTVRDTELLFGVVEKAVARGLRADGGVFFVLTNSRSFPEVEAVEANSALGALVRAASPDGGVIVVSRGDSTLRGHVVAEADALAAAIGDGAPVTRVFVPAYIEAGRVTEDGVHYIADAEGRTPVAQTPFARDATFGYRSSDLREFLRDAGAVDEVAEVGLVGLGLIRDAGAEGVARLISERADGWLVADAVTQPDLRALADGILLARDRGSRIVVRSGPSMPPLLGGQPSWPALSDEELRSAFERGGVAGGGPARGPVHGLVAVGSHVPLTTAQVSALADLPGIECVTLDAPSCARPGPARDAEIARVADLAADALIRCDVLVATSREEVRQADRGLAIAASVSDALCDVVRRATSRVTPAWVIAKGGITSHQIAASALGITSGTVIGQLFDGQVSVLRPHDGLPGTPYVIFPGNVGTADSLRRAIDRMRALRPAERTTT